MLDGEVQGVHRPRRQFRARGAGDAADGGGLAQAAPDGADRDQAQPQPSHARRGRLPAAVPRPDRDRPAGERRRRPCRWKTRTGCIHALARRRRAGERRTCCSEPAIVAGIAKATLPANPKVDWDDWVGDYALVRDAIERDLPEIFQDFNAPLRTPGGFAAAAGRARARNGRRETGKANFIVPPSR